MMLVICFETLFNIVIMDVVENVLSGAEILKFVIIEMKKRRTRSVAWKGAINVFIPSTGLRKFKNRSCSGGDCVVWSGSFLIKEIDSLISLKTF
jgi:hypothetical protein